MKITNSSVKSLFCRMSAIGAAVLVSGTYNAAYATQTVRELWDGLGSPAALAGEGSGSTSVGLDTSTTWTVSPTGQTGLSYDSVSSLSWEFGGLEYNGVLLSASGGGNGLAAFYGNNMTTLINPDTGQPYGLYASQSYATRALTTNAYIDFQANGTYYFSVRMIKNYPWWAGDNAEGIGFASSSATNADFVGAGFTRLAPFYAEDGVTDIGNSVCISTGTLDQAGISGHPDDSGGSYYPRATAPITFDPSGVDAYLLVGRLTTTTGGASTLAVKVYYSSSTLDTDPSLITWDATYSFTETNVMTRFLVWAHGTGPSLVDGIRVGTAYGDVIGLELFGAPTASPGKTVYAGTDVTLGANAGLNTGAFPMSFQWRSNSVDILDQTNSTLALTNPTPAFTADYSAVVSNFYGIYTNMIHVTVNPAVPPFFVAGGKPVSTTRYVGSPAATFTAVVDGTPPFTYQWQHAGTNIQSAVTTSSVTNTLMLPPITLADAGNYSVIVTNLFGSTNTAVPGPAATLTEIVPAAGSYAAAVTALSPFGYWALDDNATTNDPTIHDYWGNQNGQAVDAADAPNMIFGIPGPSYSGFSQPHSAVQLGNQFWLGAYRLNLSKLPNYATNMTFTMWVKGGCQFLNHNGYGNAYGLENNNGSLQFDWPGITSWNSGLSVPNDWTFVALVVEPAQATIYVGTNQVSLVSANSGAIGPISDSATLGDTAGLYPFGVARNQWPWAEDGNGAPWASTPSSWSDVAIFYQSLTPQQITNLYLAGVGLAIQGTPDGSGNLILNWIAGTLQQADNVQGPYTDIGAATPPYSVPLAPTTAAKFYRIKQ